MKPYAKIAWIVLCSLVCLVVGLAILAVLPAWNGMGDMSALEAIVYVIKNGNPLK